MFEYTEKLERFERKIVEYCMVSSRDIQNINIFDTTKVNKMVNEKIKEGFCVKDKPFISKNGDIYQLMVRYEDD